MRKLYFVRHGLSAGNMEGVFARPESPLTPEGIAQAELAAAKLFTEGPKFDLIIASPMRRARHTAEVIAGGLNYPIEAIELNPLLVERNFGELTGKSTTGFYDRFGVQAIDDIEGAEKLAALQARAEQALDYVKAKDEDINILLVSHGAFGRAFRRAVAGWPYTDEYIGLLLIGNGEVLELI